MSRFWRPKFDDLKSGPLLPMVGENWATTGEEWASHFREWGREEWATLREKWAMAIIVLTCKVDPQPCLLDSNVHVTNQTKICPEGLHSRQGWRRGYGPLLPGPLLPQWCIYANHVDVLLCLKSANGLYFHFLLQRVLTKL